MGGGRERRIITAPGQRQRSASLRRALNVDHQHRVIPANRNTREQGEDNERHL